LPNITRYHVARFNELVQWHCLKRCDFYFCFNEFNHCVGQLSQKEKVTMSFFYLLTLKVGGHLTQLCVVQSAISVDVVLSKHSFYLRLSVTTPNTTKGDSNLARHCSEKLCNPNI